MNNIDVVPQPSYREKAEAALDAVMALNDEINRLYDDQSAPNRYERIGRAKQQLRTQMKFAEVYATMSYGEVVEERIGGRSPRVGIQMTAEQTAQLDRGRAVLDRPQA